MYSATNSSKSWLANFRSHSSVRASSWFYAKANSTLLEPVVVPAQTARWQVRARQRDVFRVQ
jgi:hypothetical protein